MRDFIIYIPKSGNRPEFDCPHIYYRELFLETMAQIERNDLRAASVESICGKHRYHVEEVKPFEERPNFSSKNNLPEDSCEECKKIMEETSM